MMRNNEIFEDLFVLEMTNNHQGRLERGMQIIETFSPIIKSSNIRSGIKLQFRDLNNYIHNDYFDRTDIPYVRRIKETWMSKENYALLVEAIRKNGCIPLATPFDERSVSWCVEFELPIIKIASVEANDWVLIRKIAETKKPVIASTGGLSVADLDNLVSYFDEQQIPLALNHCTAAYPTEDNELDLNQIDFLRDRYPGHVIGLSTHEHKDWTSSMLISYAKGARLFERHVDIITDGAAISPYSTLPNQIETWFKAYHKAKEMCGANASERRMPLEKELEYFDSHLRGLYASTDLVEGQVLSEENFYLAIPLQKGQLSTREFLPTRFFYKMTKQCKKGQPIAINMIDLLKVQK